jgi:cyclase
MHNVRLIARLDIKAPNLIKGIHLEGLRKIGDPQDHARAYYAAGADEIIYMDIVASLYNRNSLSEIVRHTAERVFIPITVGGGIRSLADTENALRAGADKVAINTAAIRRPDLIMEASRKFGSSTIVVAIDAIRRADGSYEAYTDYGREKTGIDAYEWAVRAT